WGKPKVAALAVSAEARKKSRRDTIFIGCFLVVEESFTRRIPTPNTDFLQANFIRSKEGPTRCSTGPSRLMEEVLSGFFEAHQRNFAPPGEYRSRFSSPPDSIP
ncbi:MAG: hypothetical protein N3G20_03915, partial [Verrucomicrobiae bacterium]|nr:hypothetical protein [Verrucomicrobiae bacterium]